MHPKFAMADAISGSVIGTALEVHRRIEFSDSLNS
jgi:hypothetical protein